MPYIYKLTTDQITQEIKHKYVKKYVLIKTFLKSNKKYFFEYNYFIQIPIDFNYCNLKNNRPSYYDCQFFIKK